MFDQRRSICSNVPFCLMCGFSLCRDLEVKLAQAVRDLSRMTDDLKSAGLPLSHAPESLLMLKAPPIVRLAPSR